MPFNPKSVGQALDYPLILGPLFWECLQGLYRFTQFTQHEIETTSTTYEMVSFGWQALKPINSQLHGLYVRTSG
jgi:hypothetical protein